MGEHKTDNLWMVSIFLEDTRVFRLGFRSEARARGCYEAVVGDIEEPVDMLSLEDDFGTQMVIACPITTVSMVQPAKELQMQAEVQLVNARANVYLQKAAKADPVLNQSGPALVVPGPGAGAFR